MATYAVDSIRQPMTATGIVEPIMEWEETPDGRRRPSERQARNEDTGMPLWAVEVIYRQSSWGRVSNTTATVTVGCLGRPVVEEFGRVEFTDLWVETRVNKAGGLVESWTADGVAGAKAVPDGKAA